MPVSASPAVLPGVGAVLAADDGHVRLVDHSLAKTYWQRRLDSSIYASVVVDRSRRHVLVTATSGLVACGRTRLMLLPSLTVYKMHKDSARRAHIAVRTNADTRLVFRDGFSYHVPPNGRLHVLNTTVPHPAYNVVDV